VNAAKAYVRVLIRVPEAYLLLKDFKAKRPGLLVLDGDGRRVGAIALAGAKPANVARALTAWKDAMPVESLRIRLTKPDVDWRLLTRAVFRKGDRGTATKRDGHLIFRMERGGLSPARLTAAAKESGVEFEWIDPVPVTTKTTDAPGVWYAEEGRCYVTRVLLSPSILGESDIEQRVFKLPGVSRGASGAPVAAAPLKEQGVLTVFADLFHDREIVVGRKNAVDWKKVEAALERAKAKSKATAAGR
jgi:hypothetical protein